MCSRRLNQKAISLEGNNAQICNWTPKYPDHVSVNYTAVVTAFFPCPPGVRALYTPLTPHRRGKQWGQVGELVSLHFPLWMGIDESEGSRGFGADGALPTFSGKYLKSVNSLSDLHGLSAACVEEDQTPWAYLIKVWFLFVIHIQTGNKRRGTHEQRKHIPTSLHCWTKSSTSNPTNTISLTLEERVFLF